jgi:DNA-binding PucR family transcriptional regulator
MDLRVADPLGSQEQVAAVAARMGHGLAELANDIRDVIQNAIPALRDDRSNSMLEASIRANVERTLGILEHGVDPTAIAPPVAAVEYARRLAQRGVPVFALIRAYRLGHATFLHHVIENLVEHGSGSESVEGRATLEIVDRVHASVDSVIEALLVTYAQERDEWLNPNAILRARVRSVLTETGLDIESAQQRLGNYRLRQHHLGAELWVPDAAAGADSLARLRVVAEALATAAGCVDPPMLVALDDATICAWLPVGTETRVERNRLAAVLPSSPEMFVALGEPEPSLAGFRRTHEQALSAQAVARVNPGSHVRLVPYSDIAPIATMVSNLAAARAWVHETLGPLAVDGDRQAGLRETLRVFFATGGSYAATAKALGMHRNTAQYRVRTAEELRGRPLREGRLDVELALLACHWFGSAVLASPN